MYIYIGFTCILLDAALDCFKLDIYQFFITYKFNSFNLW